MAMVMAMVVVHDHVTNDCKMMVMAVMVVMGEIEVSSRRFCTRVN